MIVPCGHQDAQCRLRLRCESEGHFNLIPGISIRMMEDRG